MKQKLRKKIRDTEGEKYDKVQSLFFNLFREKAQNSDFFPSE